MNNGLAGSEWFYDAFLSYSHAADGRLALAIQRGLQRLTRPWAPGILFRPTCPAGG